MNRKAEYLTSNRLNDDLWHAHYPTADYTLCGRRAPDAYVAGRKRAPTCETCVANARLLNAIDSSAPRHWGMRRTQRDVDAVSQIEAMAA